MADPFNTWTGTWTETWTDMGTQLWKNWADVWGTAGRNPLTPQPVSESIDQRLIDQQQFLLRLLKLSFSTWQEIFPKINAGENWQQSIDRYLDQIRTQFDGFSSSTLKVSQDAAELWQLYFAETQKFTQLWAKAWGSSIDPLRQATATGKSEPWLELNDLYWNLLYEESFGSLMRSPLLGPTREFNGKLLRAYDAWGQLYRATIDYQVVLNTVQMQSFEALMHELVDRAERGDTVKDWRQFQQVWGQVADDVFEKAFCTEANLKIRGRFLNTLNTYRICQQELMELSLSALNMPTRSEVDELHKTVYELRKQVKQLNQAIAHYQARGQAGDRSTGDESSANSSC